MTSCYRRYAAGIPLACGLFLIATTACVGTAQAATDWSAQREYGIKAGIIYGLIQFTDWPAKAFSSTSDPIVVCVFGRSEFPVALKETIGPRARDGRRVSITSVIESDELPRCHVAFIEPSHADGGAAIINALKGSAALTVGEGEPFAQAGGMVSLKQKRTRITFDIALKPIKAEGLNLSSHVLKLAGTVRQD